jgi:hypothetical protein
LLSGVSAESKNKKDLCALCASKERSEWAVNLILHNKTIYVKSRFTLNIW